MPRTRLLVPVLAALALAGCAAAAGGGAGNGLPTAAPTHRAGQLAVVAAESLWGDVATQIGGPHVAVTSILTDPAQDPHEYESTVGDAAYVAAADVVIVNGAGYDPFMGRLLSANPRPGRTTLTVAREAGVHAGANPHLWYDPAYVRDAARAIEREFARRQPASAPTFAAGLRRFLTGEARVDAVIAAIRRAHAGAKVGYTEPVPGYLVAAAGLRLGTPRAFSIALENGGEPTPADSAHFEQAIRQHTVEALLLNTQIQDPETVRLASIARSSGVPVVDVTETLPRGQHLQTWQADQATSLLRALDG